MLFIVGRVFVGRDEEESRFESKPHTVMTLATWFAIRSFGKLMCTSRRCKHAEISTYDNGSDARAIAMTPLWMVRKEKSASQNGLIHQRALTVKAKTLDAHCSNAWDTSKKNLVISTRTGYTRQSNPQFYH